MADILRVPLMYDLGLYRNTSALLSGGEFSTSFIELPNSYIIGGYEYSKNLVAADKNGFVGLLPDMYTESVQSIYANPNTLYKHNLGLLNTGLLGYFGGIGMATRVSNSGSPSLQRVLFLQDRVACGTVGRRPCPMPHIRDSKESNIIYLVASGPYSMGNFGVAKYDTKAKTMVWRTINTDIGSTDTHTFNSASNGIVGVTGNQVEYLYQTQTELVFAVGIFRGSYAQPLANGRYGDHTVTDLSIQSVNKKTGNISEMSYFTAYTLGLTDKQKTHMEYNLVYIDNNFALFDIQGTSFEYQTNNFTAQAQSAADGMAIKALVCYAFSLNEARIMWKQSQYHTPLMYIDREGRSPSISSSSSVKEGIYKLSGSLVIPELNNSLFVPHAIFGTTYSSPTYSNTTQIYLSSCELMHQLHLNDTKTEVLSSKVLPVFSTWGKKLKFYTNIPYLNVAPTKNENIKYGVQNRVLDHIGSNVEEKTSTASLLAYTHMETFGSTSLYYPFGSKWYDPEEMAYGSPYMVTTSQWFVWNSIINTPNTRALRVAYDHIKTERTEPILRVHELKTESAPRKTVMPKGEDIIANGCSFYNYMYGTYKFGIIHTYNTSIGCAYPWGVTILLDKFNLHLGNQNTSVTTDPKSMGLTNPSLGSPTYQTNWSYNDQYSNESSVLYQANYYEGTLPDCSYTLRRSHTDLKKCGIYLNNKAFPIKAVSYSINPMPELPNGAPTAWVLEALDVATDKWIEVDRQENVALTVPLWFRAQHSRGSALCIGARYGWGAESRQYRNYFHLKDMDTKCPKGAHAFKITFKDSRDGQKVVIQSFMVQEEPWPWVQVTCPGSLITAVALSNMAGTGNSQLLGIKHNSNGASDHPYYSSTCPSISSYAIPLSLSVIGPRVSSSVGLPYNTSTGYYQMYFGSYYYSSNAFNNPAQAFITYNFGAEKLEIQGIQFTMIGVRDTGYYDGCAVPSALWFQGSNNNSDWTTLADITDADLMPGLQIDSDFGTTEDKQKKFFMKTFLFELDAPVAYQFYRVRWADGATNLGSSYSNFNRHWIINNFSFFKKRNGDDHKRMLPMQSFLGGSAAINYLPKTAYYPEEENPAIDKYWANTWSAWVPETASIDGSQHSTFDMYYYLNLGYWSSAASVNPYLWNAKPTEEKPAVVKVSWEGSLTKEIKLPILYKQTGIKRKLGALVDVFPGTDESWPWEPAHMDKVKIVRYAFVYASNIAVPMNERPKKWKLYGSQDSKEWTVLDERTKEDWKNTDAYTEFKVQNPDWYSHYKLEITEKNGGTANSILMSSIDTFIEIPEEDSEHLHTIRPRNMVSWVPTDCVTPSYDQLPQSYVDQYAQNLAVVKGTTVKSNPNDLVRELGNCESVDFSYDGDSIELDVDQGCKLQTNSLVIRLSPSMEDEELPKKITIKGSNDQSEWTTLSDNKAVTWNLGDDPYKTRIEFDTSGVYRYIKVVFYKPELAPDHKFIEHWLHRTHICAFTDYLSSDGNSTYLSPQITFKVKSDKYFIQCGHYFERPTSNLWLGDDTFAQVYPYSIGIMKMDPITQRVRNIRTTYPTGGGYLLGAVLDSSKNLWYWSNTLTSNTTNNTTNATAYHTLAVQSSYSPVAVHVRFESPTAVYDGNTITKKLSVWIEDPTVLGDNKKVAGRVKVVLTGCMAKFVSNAEASTEVELEDGKDKELEFTAEEVGRVLASAYLLR